MYTFCYAFILHLSYVALSLIVLLNIYNSLPVAQEPSLTYGQASHVGLKRSDNQDSFGKFPRENALSGSQCQLFIVADGMGGHMGGREASQMAVHIIDKTFFLNTSRDVGKRLRNAFESANAQIFQRAQQDTKLSGMGTTCTAVALKRNRAWVAHIGDSRAYHISQQIKQLTIDHTRVEEMVRQKILTKEEAARHPQRHILSRAMGVGADMQLDVHGPLSIQAGDYFLICSDGLSRVTKQELFTTVLSFPPQETCDQLIQLANNRGGHDNVTVQVVRVNHIPRRLYLDNYIFGLNRRKSILLVIFLVALLPVFLL